MAELRRRSEAGGSETRVSEHQLLGEQTTVRVQEMREAIKEGIDRSLSHHIGEEDSKSDVGQTVSVTYGEELYSIVQYNSFRVGPFTITTVVRDGETIADALLRGHRHLAEAVRTIRRERADAHIEELKRLGIGLR